ncbi:G-type lectin S-receptor-like serine/threonine-protein kinase [Hirschfeldia incana]|nr:G-type lectin S-receptor-like serine/threonine-protein kinase [Hirschfeldia incana]
MDPIASVVEKVKLFKDSVSRQFGFHESPSRQNPIDILKRLQREAFSEITKLRDRQEKVERVISSYKLSNGGPFQEASTHVKGEVDVLGGVLMMGDSDDESLDGLYREGVRPGLLSRFVFETKLGETDRLVAELVAGYRGEGNHVSGNQLSLAKVFCKAEINDWFSAVAVPVGARFRDIDSALVSSYQGMNLTEVSELGPPLLNQHNGSAIGLTLKKSNMAASLGQSITSLEAEQGLNATNSCFRSFGQVTCNVLSDVKLSLLGCHQIISPSNSLRYSAGAITVPVSFLRRDFAIEPESSSAPTLEMSRGTNHVSSSSSIALKLDSLMDESTRVGGWIEIQNSREKQVKWSVSITDKPEDEVGWGMSVGGVIVDGSRNHDRFQVESYLKFNIGDRFSLSPAFSCFSLKLCSGSEDSITFSTPIKDSETLVSSSGVFRFGFFTPVNSTARLRYVGIWYDKIPVQTVVWVANRDAPVKDTSGVVTISEDGNLVVKDGLNRLLWSTNITSTMASNATSVQLMDTGNLRLLDGRNKGETLWESFKHPYNTFLPTMTLGTSNRTRENLKLTSWKSYDDPSTGNYTAGLAPFAYPELLIWKDNVPIWRSGLWNGQHFIGLPDVVGFNLSNDYQGTASLSYGNDSLMYHLDPDGVMYQRYLSASTRGQRIGGSITSTACDSYGECGPFASCSSREVPPCNCVKGFEPRNQKEWNDGNWINGCVRVVPLRCKKENNVSSSRGKGDEFLKLQKMKVPVSAERSLANEKDCSKQCLENCSCTAYAYDGRIGCMIWSDSLVDMQSSLASGIDLYIRIAHPEKKQSHLAIVIGAAFVAAAFLLLACQKFKKRSESRRRPELMFNRMEPVTSENESPYVFKPNEFPLFEFQVLAKSTDYFSHRNKLGQGGFGPVYKGKLPEGQEIAVKRLSRASRQGLEELMNEVVVISKLQHRNLVRVLGCCIEGEERLLVYEYMPNKSLDAYLFDPTKQKILDWKTRFNIMEGISRGLLYLHRDSRLKIIHRDLKASNILLDDNLNPKISDFGLARVFEGNEDEAETRKVVGTYGYMSPEYAMEGYFSEKSDVFSLGVIFLEIISGRRNSHKEENDLNLLAYAWNLWNDGEAASLANPAVFDECFEKEIAKCVQIGLLCVQELANDRPNVSNVIWMLTTENAHLPEAKQPAFIARREFSVVGLSDRSSQMVTIDDASLTAVSGR